MSSNAPEAGSRGRKKVDPNESDAQKLVRLSGSRVTSVLARLEMVGNLGPILHKVASENNIDPNQIITQILGPVIEKFNAMKQSLETGKPTKTGFDLKL